MSVIRAARRLLCGLLCPGLGSEPGQDARPDAYPPVVLGHRLAARTQELLRSFNVGSEGREGLVYWAGVARGRGGVVTTLVVPDAESSYGRVETSAMENARVIRWLSRHDLVLLGQAHSHPPGGGARHSPGDDDTTFSPFEGQISVVVADHASAGSDILATWGVHRFINGRFQRIPRDRWDEHLQVVVEEHDHRVAAPEDGSHR